MGRNAVEQEEAKQRAGQELRARQKQWAEQHTATALLKNKELVKAATKEPKTPQFRPKLDLKKSLKSVKDWEKKVKKSESGGRTPPPGTEEKKTLAFIHRELAQRGLIKPEPSYQELPTFRVLTAVSEFWPTGGGLVLGDAAFAGGPWAVHVTMGIPLTALNQRLRGPIDGSRALEYLAGKDIPVGSHLTAFLRLVASYLWGAEHWETTTSKNPKQMVSLLARNNFAKMFLMVPEDARLAIAKQPNVWLEAWATESKTLGAPFLARPVETPYTRSKWLESMIGTVTEKGHREGSDLVAEDPSLDSMGKWKQFDVGKDGEPIPIFEDRLHENWAPGDWIARGSQYFEKNVSLLEG